MRLVSSVNDAVNSNLISLPIDMLCVVTGGHWATFRRNLGRHFHNGLATVMAAKWTVYSFSLSEILQFSIALESVFIVMRSRFRVSRFLVVRQNAIWRTWPYKSVTFWGVLRQSRSYLPRPPPNISGRQSN